MQAVLAEAADLRRAGVDLIEWRIDAFAAAEDADAVLAVMAHEAWMSSPVPVLCTFRSRVEGGARETSPALIATILRKLAEQGIADMLDLELRWPTEQTDAIVAAAHRHGMAIMFSQHDFQRTPSLSSLLAAFEAGRARGGDAVKIAVMPETPVDVDRLLEATRRASDGGRHAVIGIAMGELGVRSRIEAGAYGSVLTFAAGQRASAPGQWPIESLRSALEEHYGSSTPMSLR